MVPAALLGYFLLLPIATMVVAGALPWWAGVIMVGGFLALERVLFRASRATDGDDEYDHQQDAHLHATIASLPQRSTISGPMT